MKTNIRRSVSMTLAAFVAVPGAALATNGYFAHGWGTKSKAMAGVAAALPQDTLVSATNPAGMAFVGNRMDLGVSFFSPSDRGYKANPDFATQPVPATDGVNNFTVDFPAGPFVTPGEYDSNQDWFLIPSFGYNRVIDSRSTIGISAYGNGGMNTKYADRPVWENFAIAPNQLVDNEGNPLFVGVPDQGLLITPDGPVPITDPNVPPPPDGNNGNPGGVFTATTPTGVWLEQLFIEVPYTYKFSERQAIGIAPVFAVQRFKAYGLEPFKGASVSPDNVTGNGWEWDYGAGLQVGWYGEISDQLAFGASYRSKIYMTDINEYKGLFADGGEFDIPAVFNLGVAFKPRSDITLAADYQHIFYSEIDALSNSNDKDLTPCFTQDPKPSFCLGGRDGLGFGWDSMDILKVGARYDYNDKMSFMAGVSYNSEFSSGRQALFNVLAPATVRWHLSLGASYRHSKSDEFNLAFTYMPKERLTGTSPSITQSQTGSIYMEQKEIEISWTHHF